MSPAAANRHGILAMLAAMTLFTAADALLKLATAALPPGEIMAVRGAFAVTLVLGLIAGRGEAGRLRDLGQPAVLLRSALEAVVACLFITSLSALPIANVTAILQATPIILTLLTVALGLERVGWRRWAAVCVGFVGVLFVVKPSPTGMNLYAVLALACAALVAVRDLATRRIGPSVPTAVITLSGTAAVTLLGLGLAAGETWRVPTGLEVALLGAAAVLVSMGNLAIVKAFRTGEISVVSPFRYTIVLTALAVGWLVFGEWPDAFSIFGIALIVASGLYTLHADQSRPAAATKPVPAVAGDPL